MSAEERSCLEEAHTAAQRNGQEMSNRRSCDIYLTVCNLFWLGPATKKEVAEEAARD